MSDNKASSSRSRHPVMQFSTAMGTPETKRKMLLYRRLLSRELARDGKNPKEIARASSRRLQEQDGGRCPKS
ncbi:uncharacterized protein LOC6541557 [Drosophila erecta]|uniref:Uncharacterized protein n=1 Tax=Drosophila erecta TaxID=7220 RepID=B3N5D3_DROER|nr:uncharacterized protein LOC6541557 [Drosophila erecta]EDV59012.1 uncharacterized protein Dere_GG23654 [Drosophila erecta]